MFGTLSQVYQSSGNATRYDRNYQTDVCCTIPVVITVDTRGYSQGSTSISNKANYVIPLSSDFRDVVSIELVHAIVPNKGFEYVILSLNGYKKMIGNSNQLESSFCCIGSPDPNHNNSLVHKRFAGIPDDTYTYYFPEPSKLSKLEIQLTNPDGSVPVYSSSDHHVLIFEIRTMLQQRKPAV